MARLAVSRARGQPAFCIFSNAVLDAIVAAAPQSEAALRRIKGMGPTKVAEHGGEILR
jgi:superfamily II DNA helicase RecQ